MRKRRGAGGGAGGWRKKKDKWGEGWPDRGRVLCRRLKPFAHYVRINAACFVTTFCAESMSFNHFFIPFRLKWKISQWTKIIIPDSTNFLDLNRSQNGKYPGPQVTLIKWNLWFARNRKFKAYTWTKCRKFSALLINY